MEPNNDQVNVDPEYQSNNSVLRLLLNKDKENILDTGEKICSVIADEFNKELTLRESQLVDIETKIAKAQKLLHLIRYVIISSYYNKKTLQHTINNDEDSNALFDKQNRIHPAIKKLLGNNATTEIFNNHGKRRVTSKNCVNNETSASSHVTKKAKLDIINSKKNHTLDGNQNCIQNRRKIKHRLVVGNISKYMPSLDDQTTHKWLIYVRGDNNKPDISDIVEKVVFNLHPSYKPHDIVELRSPPFHLARRGWGEFPLRVQIFFVCSLNKPIDVIHNLRLDKTMSGRQMLGNETLIDLYLHENMTNEDSIPIKQEYFDNITYCKSDEENLNSEIIIKEENHDTMMETDQQYISENNSSIDMLVTKLEDINASSSSLQSDENSFEHNYCQDEEKYNLSDNEELSNYYLFEHSYSIPVHNEKLQLIEKEQLKETNFMEQEDNSLKYGLGPSYLENIHSGTNNKIHTELSSLSLSQPIKILPSNLNQIIRSNGEVVPLKLIASQEPQVKLVLAQPSGAHLTEPNLKIVLSQNPQVPQSTIPLTDKTYKDWFKQIVHSKYTDGHTFCERDWQLKSLLRVTSLQRPFDKSVFSQIWDTVINRIGHELMEQSYFKIYENNISMLPEELSSQADKKYRVYLPQNKFTNLGQALPFLFKRLPLWHAQAKEEEFKSIYSFMAASKEEFESWHIGRRLSSEWRRAREIRKIISKANFPLQEKWTTKTYFMYARSHGYSPIKKPSLITIESLEDYARICFIYNPRLQKTESSNKEIVNDVDFNIDVESSEDTRKSETSLIMLDQRTKLQCTFVREAARDCGIVLKPEEIIEGVTMNASERIMLEAMKCFAENLIRRAHFYLTCEKSYRKDGTITGSMISKVIREREEMKAISEFQVGKKMREFYS